MAPPLPLLDDRWRLGRMSITSSHKKIKQGTGHFVSDHGETVITSLR